MKSLFLSFLMCMTATVAFALDVTGLRTEDYHNPVGLDKGVVHFSWQLQSEHRSVLQTSYNVQIATDAVFGNVVWESGSVSSDESVFVEAKGFKPAAETRYYWRVTVTDNKGETATSTEKAYFETGLAPSGSPFGGEDCWSGSHWIKALPQRGSGEGASPTDYDTPPKGERGGGFPYGL